MELEFRVDRMERILSSNAVLKVRCMVSLTDGDDTIKTKVGVTLPYDPLHENFLPFEQLTSEIVIGWVKEDLGIDELDLIELSMTEFLHAVKKNADETTTKFGCPWLTGTDSNHYRFTFNDTQGMGGNNYTSITSPRVSGLDPVGSSGVSPTRWDRDETPSVTTT